MDMEVSQSHYQSLWRIMALSTLNLALSACIAVGPPAFSYDAQAQGNKICAKLFAATSLQPLKTYMPLLPGEMPSRAMLLINEAPSENQSQAIRALETAVRNCKSMRAAAGQPTSASEDILESRISKLRYGLYNGDIPYGVYNYGLVQALKKHTEFMVQGEQAYTQGKAAGDASLINMGMSRALQKVGTHKTWSCSSDSLGNTMCY